MAQKKRTQPLLILRNREIQKAFKLLVDKKENGISIYSLDLVYNRLEQKFFITRKTLETIVKGTYRAKLKQ